MKNILEYRGYFTKIEYSAEDQVLYGKIEGINDLVNLESNKLEDIVAEFHSAVDDYLEMCRCFGKEPDKEYSVHNVGDVCLYSFPDGNKSLAIVEIVRILDDERGVAEIKFLKVIVDDTGNGFFEYLLKSGKTMNASFQYLKTIVPSK